ncbi:hypothetical protein ACM66B_004908 [Microbotryomycetes sp. NB124-2]
MGLSYAQLRAKRMQAHDEALAEIQPDLPPPKPEKVQSSTPRKRKAPASPAEPRVATRRSGRVVQSQRTAEEKQAAEEEEDRLWAEQRERDRIAKHGDRQLEALSGVHDSKDTETLTQLFNDVLVPFATSYEDDDSKKTSLKKGGKGSAKASPAKNEIPSEKDVKVLKSKTDKLEHRATVKVIPDRIYSMTIHPHALRDLIFVGDKSGHVGLWDATDAGLEDDEGGAQTGSFWHWKQHYGSVSMLKFAPNDYSNIYSSSYDCTLRRLNFETGKHEEVLDADQWDDDLTDQSHLIHSFDFDNTGQNLWAVDNVGGLIHRDMREPMESARRWRADAKAKKIGGFSINPSNPSVGVTAHLKQEMKVWDLGKLVDLPEDASSSVIEECTVATYPHKNACSSAYFDRTGTKILSTSYDNKLRVFEMDPWKLSTIQSKAFEPTCVMNHDCQVGRYVTVFKAQWSMCPTLPSHLTVGNMKRTIDVYAPVAGVKSTMTRVQGLTDDSISAVPAVTAAHPIRECVFAGGNASGKRMLNLQRNHERVAATGLADLVPVARDQTFDSFGGTSDSPAASTSTSSLQQPPRRRRVRRPRNNGWHANKKKNWYNDKANTDDESGSDDDDERERIRRSGRQAEMQKMAEKQALLERKLERERVRAEKQATKPIACLRGEADMSFHQDLVNLFADVLDDGGQVMSSPLERSWVASDVEKVEHKYTKKLVPDMIGSVQWSATPRRRMLLAGDQQGHIGLLAASEDAAFERSSSWYWKAHQKAIFSSSLDGTVRRLDLGSIEHELALNADTAEGSLDSVPPIVGFDVDEQGQSLWAVDRPGHLHHRDMRVPTKESERFNVGGRLSDVALMSDERALATAQLDGPVRIWDVRAVRKKKDGSYQAVTMIQRTQACGSVQVVASKLVTSSASIDNVVQVFDMQFIQQENPKPEAVILHNCQLFPYFAARPSLLAASDIDSPLCVAVPSIHNTVSVYLANKETTLSSVAELQRPNLCKRDTASPRGSPELGAPDRQFNLGRLSSCAFHADESSGLLLGMGDSLGNVSVFARR